MRNFLGNYEQGKDMENGGRGGARTKKAFFLKKRKRTCKMQL